MTLRVYFEDEDGSVYSVEYGCDASKKAKIIKVELLTDVLKSKTWIGSKYVGIPEIDSELDKPKKKKKKTENYEIFDSSVHDTDKNYYWISALCINCQNSAQIAIKKNAKVDRKKLKPLKCPKCKIKGSLRQARWNGHEYKVIKG